MRQMKLVLVSVLCLFVVSGCGKWREKYQACNAENENLRALFDGCQQELKNNVAGSERDDCYSGCFCKRDWRYVAVPWPVAEEFAAIRLVTSSAENGVQSASAFSLSNTWTE